MTHVVELADPATWPRAFHDLAQDAARNGPVADSWLPDGVDEAVFLTALDGTLLRTYHCTQLTASEIDWVNEEGLHPLSPELVQRKVAQAVADGHLSADEGQLYTADHQAGDPNRAGAVCLVGDRDDLSDIVGVGWLLSVWGGEGIYMAFHSHSEETKRLEQVGTPSVVVALIDPSSVSYAHPGIGLSATRRIAGAEPGTTIRTTSTIGPDHIEAIYHPGSPFWEQHVRWAPS